MLNRKAEVAQVKVKAVVTQGIRRGFNDAFMMKELGLANVSDDVTFVPFNDEVASLTALGMLLYPGEVPENKRVPLEQAKEGNMFVQLGSTKHIERRNMLKSMFNETYRTLKKEAREDMLARKNYGREVNKTFKVMGLNEKMISQYWSLKCRHILSPEMWCNLIQELTTNVDRSEDARICSHPKAKAKDYKHFKFNVFDKFFFNRDLIQSVVKCMELRPCEEEEFERAQAKYDDNYETLSNVRSNEIGRCWTF